MKKPNEDILIDFVYGNLDSAGQEQVQQWANAHPDNAKELQELKVMLGALNTLPDQPVVPPANLYQPVQAPQAVPLHNPQSSTRKWYWAVAAAVTLLLVALLAPLQVRYNEGTLMLSFNGNVPAANKPATAAELPANMQALVNEQVALAMEQYQQTQTPVATNYTADSLEAYKDNLSAQLQAQWTAYRTAMQKDIDQATQVNQNLMLSITDRQEESLRLMFTMMERNQRKQTEQVQAVLSAFANVLENRRQEDLEQIAVSLQSTQQQQQATQLALTQLAQQVGGRPDNSVGNRKK